jgi:hypothetical protein
MNYCAPCRNISLKGARWDEVPQTPFTVSRQVPEAKEICRGQYAPPLL